MSETDHLLTVHRAQGEPWSCVINQATADHLRHFLRTDHNIVRAITDIALPGDKTAHIFWFNVVLVEIEPWAK